jgi:hypothetical protein
MSWACSGEVEVSEAAVKPYRAIAAAILQQAVKDLEKPGETGKSARAFLRGRGESQVMLEWCCQAAGINDQRVRAWAHMRVGDKFTTGRRRAAKEAA